MSDESSSQSSGSKDGDPLSFISRLKRRFFRRVPEGTLRESLEEVIEDHPEGGVEGISDEERSLLMNTLEFADMRVEDVMIPRADVIAVDEKLALPALVQAFAEAEVSRMPVYRGTLDEVVGLVHLKDVFIVLAKARGTDGRLRSFKDVTLADMMRPILHVPSSMRLPDLLLKMRARRVHMAVVVDEYGGTDGLVTNEDLLEQIVGDIEDEHDIDEDGDSLTTIDDVTYEAGGRLAVEDLETALGRSLRQGGDETEDVDTLGGLVVALAGRVPHKGELVIFDPSLAFEVLEADSRRLKKLRIMLTTGSEPQGAVE
ncbi:hemolysin family protein [Govanella unica]|uniref:Hemolysin family protein n=1 Tax=Govanella unica TaxID=2975056 RepID=A0A9X3Z856_9PROT|nr:hemolysin family protein [Govania unica]MDA5194689.1 hemolysin family protein [Govania unica]